MFCACKFIILGLYLSTLQFRAHSFVLLTANVEDLKRIAQKFVSDSLADKIARFIIDAADNNLEFDSSNVTRNISEYNDEFDVEKKDIKADYGGEFRQKTETKTKQEFKPIKEISSTVKKSKQKTEELKKDNKKLNKKKQTKSKSKPKKTNKITTEQSSLEFYRSEKQLNTLNANAIINLEKIYETDDSSAKDVKSSRKEFENFDYFDKSDETQVKSDKKHSDIDKYTESDVSDAVKAKKDTSENVSEDFNYSNRSDKKLEDLSTAKSNLTTAIEHNEFDQYFNTNYPKSDVVATSGLVELTKSTKKESSDTGYE